MLSYLKERKDCHLFNETDALTEIGLREFSPQELTDAYKKLTRQIQIGITRQGEPTTSDGGVPAIPSCVEPITREQISSVPKGKRVLAGAYGGTSWLTAIAEKKEGVDVDLEVINNGSIPKTQRAHTLDEFVGLIADHMAHGIGDRDVSDITAVGGSVGFAYRSSKTERGFDGQIYEQPSNWRITDLDTSLSPEDQPYLGEKLLTALSYRGFPQVTEVYFQNDTNAVVHDVSSSQSDVVIPVGFVFGTGSNAAIGRFNLQESNTVVFKKDAILEKMAERGYVGSDKPLTKIWVGGDRIRFRIAAAMLLLGEKGILNRTHAEDLAEMLRDGENGTFVSDIASCNLDYLKLREKIPSLSLEEYGILLRSCRGGMRQAGQVIGVMIGSAVTAAGYEGGTVHLPVEGSVFWKGYNVQPTVEQTLDRLLPGNDLHFYPASGVRGISKLSLVYSHLRQS
ncbi:MAG: hypothetical protein KatS3mg089_0996 [Patescibacteria group bacterium]|nr:MAG: hypothetical protein KatS3mg089_0996 [Patescibacteria group bacterium]